MSKEELIYLKDLLKKLKKAKETLEYSYNICKKIKIEKILAKDEEDRFEALTSKFARLSDLILKKIIKTIDILDLEDPPQTMRDAISRAEKKGLIFSELEFIEIRKIRNEIAHDYVSGETEIVDIYNYVLKNTPYLFDAFDRILKYTEKYMNNS